MNTLTFDDYWLGYLAGHARRLTRVFHYFGLFFGQLLGLFLSFYVAWWLALIVCPSSYMIAYFSHELVEGNSNKPYATRPVWSVVSFFRMLALELTGRLNTQIVRLTPAHFAAEHP
ncbi:Mpo1-like protein [Bradyrhizobium sp. USDA 4353]